MKKSFLLIIVVVLLFSLSACETSKPFDQTVKPPANVNEIPSEVTPSESPILQATPSIDESNHTDLLNETVTVIADTFTYADAAPDASIFIEYIQITGLSDLEKQEQINNMLLQSVNLFTRDFENNPDISELKTYEIYAEYTIIGNILSLQEMTSYYHSQTPHPWVALDTMVIDMNTGNKLKLSDIMILSDSLSDKLTKEIVRPVKIVLDEHDDDLKQELFYDRLFDSIKNIYSSEYGFYLTEETIGFIMEVPHAVGDYWTFEIAYEDLQDFLKPDFQKLLTQA